MSAPISLPQIMAHRQIGLEVWMDRALGTAPKVEPNWRKGEVHDLRVALRRCRTMAEALSEVSPGSRWRRIKKVSRKLFHALGDLHDTQVERDWVKKCGPAADPVRKYMLSLLSHEERKHRKAAARRARRIRSKRMEETEAQTAAQGRFLPVGQRGFSAAGSGKVKRSRQALRRCQKEAKQHRLAPAPHRPQTFSLRG